MRKDWLWVGIVTLMLAACTTTEAPRAPITPTPAYNGPVEEIGGAAPRYEPYNPGTLQDYTIKGKTYKVVQNAQNFSEIGLATWYGAEANGNRTSIGEILDPNYRRNLRSQRHYRCAPDAAITQLCPRDKPEQRPPSGGSRERSRPVYAGQNHRFV